MATIPADEQALADAIRLAVTQPWCFAERPRWAIHDDWARFAVCVLVCAWLRALEQPGAERPDLPAFPMGERIFWTRAAQIAVCRVPVNAVMLDEAIWLAYVLPPHLTFRRQRPQESITEWRIRAITILVAEWLAGADRIVPVTG
jgi:hypothetical protein